MPERRRWTRARRWVIVGGVVVVLGGGATAWAATRSSGPAYRLATAGPAQVSSVLSATGTIQSVNQATLGFPVSGQVSAVNVQVGQQVAQGEVLATLDTTNLSSQVSSAQARAAAAQAKLASDENGQTAAASPAGGGSGGGSGSSGGGSGSSGGRAPSTGGGKPAGPPPAVASGQSAVEKAQHQVDGDISTDNAAVGQEKSACAQATGTSPAAYTRSSSTPSPSQGTDPSTSSPPTTSTEPPSGGGGSGGGGATSACTSAIQQVLDDQSRTAADEKSLADAENGLTSALDQATAAASSGGSSSGSPGSPGSPGSSAPSAPSGSSGSSGSAGRTGGSSGSSSGGRATAPPSAAQLAADQASVDATNADLAAATQNLSAATITSPIAGTVAQVTLTAGQTVAGASTQNDIVVIGPGSDEVTTTVSDLQVGQVRPGQRSTITPDGTTLRLPGLVTQVGILGSSSGGSVTYPVTISLDPTSQQLFAGATAAVSVDIASSNAQVAVPTSAVQAQGARQIVTVMRNGTATPVPVTVGVVGSTLTEIRSGLSSGDRVVIANLSAPLPTGNTNNLRIGGGGFGGAGGAGGGGRAGGGAAGGAGGAGGRPGG